MLVSLATAACAIGIFVADTITKLEIAIPVVYVIVVLMASRLYRARGVVLVAAGCVGLTLLSYYLTPHGPASEAVSNTLISVATIGLTGFLVIQSRSADMKLREQASLLDLTHDAIFARDMERVITYWNRGAEALYGWTEEQAAGRTTHDLLKTVFPAPPDQIEAEVLHAGRWEGELLHRKADGTQVTVASRWSLQRDWRGAPVAILETNNDITERKRAERQHAAVAQLGRAALSGLTLAALFHQAVVQLADVLEVEYTKVLELLPEEHGALLRAGVGWREGLVGQAVVGTGLESQAGYTLLSDSPVIVGDLRTEERFSGPPLLQEHGVVSGMSVIVHGPGRPFGVLGAHTRSERVFTEDEVNFLQSVANVLADAIERKRQEEILRQQAQIIEQIHDSVVATDLDGYVTSWNAGAQRLFGYTRDEALGKHISFVYPPDQHAFLAERVIGPLKENGALEIEVRMQRKSGAAIDGHLSLSMLHDTLGERIGMIGYSMDITERKQAEREQRRQANLLEQTHDAILVWEFPGTIIYWNRGAEQLYGYSRQEALGRHSHDLLRTAHPMPTELFEATMEQHGVWAGELTHTTRDGRRLFIESRQVLIREPDGHRFVLETNRDITERRRAEEALRESERRYRYIFEAAGVSIWEEDFSRVKDAIDDLKAQGVEDFSRYLGAHPEFIRQAISVVKIVDVNDTTVELLKAESKEEILISLDRIFLPETEAVFAGELLALWDGKTFFESETVLRSLKGDRLAVLFTIVFPGEPSKLDRVLVSIVDITERKRAEEALQKARAELAHIARVTAMGELTASIAHEVNQPLAAVVTNGNASLRWLASEPPNLDEVRECLRHIIRDGKRASEVISRIRSMVRKSFPTKTSVDLNDTIREVLAVIAPEAGRRKVTLRSELAAGLPRVCADRVQLQQVILNLLMNGVEAMKAVTGGPRELEITSRRDGAGAALVAVRDRGIGVDAESVERIFEPFYTTNPDGMGMGLPISRSIIEDHGGRLWATANEDHGATFRFTLPTMAESTRTEAKTTLSEVDDEG